MKQTIAVVGASADRSKFGNKCVRAYREAGWDVLPVNPRATEIEGLPVLASVAEVPVGVDRISVYLPPAVTLGLLPEIAAAEAGEVFFNPGSHDATVIEAAKAAGITARPACSIVDIGLSPAQFP